MELSEPRVRLFGDIALGERWLEVRFNARDHHLA
jgi:hypothetical protein